MYKGSMVAVVTPMADDGSVDYDEPFATGASGIVDMTFGFDDEGEMVLYYAQRSSIRMRPWSWLSRRYAARVNDESPRLRH